MAKLNLIEPFDISAVADITAAAASAQNLLTPDPKEVFQATTNVPVSIVVDLGSARDVNSFYVGGSNANTATFNVQKVTSLAGAGPTAIAGIAAKAIREADAKTVRAQNIHFATAPVNGRYFMFTFSANTTVNLQVGAIAVGLNFQADWDVEFGAGRRLVDTAKVTPLLSGGFGIQDGSRKAAYSWTFGDLTEAETETIWAMALRRGIGEPMVVLEPYTTATGLNEKLHYGLIRQFDQYERRDPTSTKWGLEIEEWI